MAAVVQAGIEAGVVVGRNFFRGVEAAAQKMDRVTADHMGMLATVVNALAIQDALEHQGVPTRVMTAKIACATTRHRLPTMPRATRVE